MEQTLDAALARLFGGTAPPPPPSSGGDPDERTAATPRPPVAAPSNALAAEARQIYDRAIEAQRAGDWARYGDELRRLGEVLARMRAR